MLIISITGPEAISYNKNNVDHGFASTVTEQLARPHERDHVKTMTYLKVLEINLQPGSKISVYNNQKSSFVLWLRWKQENTLTKTMTYRVMTVFCKLNWINILSWASRLSLFL